MTLPACILFFVFEGLAFAISPASKSKWKPSPPEIQPKWGLLGNITPWDLAREQQELGWSKQRFCRLDIAWYSPIQFQATFEYLMRCFFVNCCHLMLYSLCCFSCHSLCPLARTVCAFNQFYNFAIELFNLCQFQARFIWLSVRMFYLAFVPRIVSSSSHRTNGSPF